MPTHVGRKEIDGIIHIVLFGTGIPDQRIDEECAWYVGGFKQKDSVYVSFDNTNAPSDELYSGWNIMSLTREIVFVHPLSAL